MKAIEFTFKTPKIQLSEAEILADLRFPAPPERRLAAPSPRAESASR